MLRTFFIFIIGLSLNGCFMPHFNKADASGVEAGEIIIWKPFRHEANGETERTLTPQEEQIQKYLNTSSAAQALNIRCGMALPVHKLESIGPAAVPFVSTFAKLAFDQVMISKARSLDELKKSTIKTYSGRLFDTSKNVRTWPCVGIARFTKVKDKERNVDTEKLGMLALFDIIHFDAEGVQTTGVTLTELRTGNTAIAMRMEPILVQVFDAVAQTKKKEKETDKAEAISLSYAIAYSGIEQEQSKQPQAVIIGAGVLNIQNIPIGKDAKPKVCKYDACSTTGLMPIPTMQGPIEFTIAVTETGNAGFNIDYAKADLEAIKKAIGPVIKSSVETKLSNED